MIKLISGNTEDKPSCNQLHWREMPISATEAQRCFIINLVHRLSFLSGEEEKPWERECVFIRRSRCGGRGVKKTFLSPPLPLSSVSPGQYNMAAKVIKVRCSWLPYCLGDMVPRMRTMVGTTGAIAKVCPPCFQPFFYAKIGPRYRLVRKVNLGHAHANRTSW